MPKFKICVQQFVEETAALEIEADTAEQAVAIAERKLSAGEIDNWSAGDDITDREVYAILDKHGDAVWER